MPTPQRQPGLGLIGQLLAEPHRFEFFQAARLVSLAMRQDSDAERAPIRLRFNNRLSLAFAPSDIGGAGQEHPSYGGPEYGMRITPAFLGMLGSSGALPLHYSQRIASHERQTGDGAARAFLDLLTHRTQGMFYQAWAKHRPECMAAGGSDGFLSMLTALSGACPGNSSRHARAIARETLAFYAVQVRSRTASAATMSGIYSEYFGMPVQVQQLIGEWQPLPAQHQAQLGVANVSLDGGVLLGARLYGCDTRVRVRIATPDRNAFERFLPGGEGAASLHSLLQLHVGAGMRYEIRPVLPGTEVRGFSLAATEQAGGARLGVNTYLQDGPTSQGWPLSYAQAELGKFTIRDITVSLTWHSFHFPCHRTNRFKRRYCQHAVRWFR
jgi:type VI secretion system protein ImpH